MIRYQSIFRFRLLTIIWFGLVVDAASAVSPPPGGAAKNATTAAALPSVQQSEDTGGPEGAQSKELLVPSNRLTWHVPDPEFARQSAQEELERARQDGDKAAINYHTRVLERIDRIRRPERTHLTLEDAVRRTLANNYAIEVVRFNPAIETARVVEAEAAFDATFFANVTNSKVDRPTGSQLFATQRDFFELSTGVRKLLASGAQVSASYSLTRTKQDFVFQVINPEYFSSLILEIRQPLLRNFGIDFNRSLIVIAKNDRRISDLAFRRQVRDTLRTVEELYWRVVQARRDVVITARVLADFEAIYEYLVARQAFDITPVQISATKAGLEQARADFVRRRANVFDAEDRLIALMNDPDINLAEAMELIADDFPELQPIAVDRLAEVQTALENRTEIKEQTLRVANAKIGVGRAKSGELPRLDLSFRATHDGLARNADASFDELSRRKFIEYFVGVELEVPIGNRGPRAASRRAQLQHAQAIAQLRRVFEEVIFDVNLAVRQLETSFDQIGPSFESAEAREREVNSIVARAERKDFNTLRAELDARQGPRGLTNARRAMLSAMVDYNIAVIDLERAKGTLLQYNNVVITSEVD